MENVTFNPYSELCRVASQEALANEKLNVHLSNEFIQDSIAQERSIDRLFTRTGEPTEIEINEWKDSYEKVKKMNLDEIRKKVVFEYDEDEHRYWEYTLDWENTLD